MRNTSRPPTGSWALVGDSWRCDKEAVGFPAVGTAAHVLSLEFLSRPSEQSQQTWAAPSLRGDG